MIVRLLTEHHLEFLSLKGGCRGSSEPTLVKMSNCWKSHAAAHYTPRKQKFAVGILFSRCPCVRASVCASVRNALFP